MTKRSDIPSTDRLHPVIPQRAEREVPELVLTTLALACRIDRETISRSTRLHDLDVDSLTLVAVLARIEATYGVELTTEDMLALFAARDVGTFIRAVEELLARAGEGGAERGDG